MGCATTLVAQYRVSKTRWPQVTADRSAFICGQMSFGYCYASAFLQN
jgi:hypothetical protein